MFDSLARALNSEIHLPVVRPKESSLRRRRNTLPLLSLKVEKVEIAKMKQTLKKKSAYL